MNTKTAFWLLCLTAMVATGCRNHYQITLNNGNRVTTSTKPKLVRGYYVFENMNGQTNYVSENRVRSIEPQPRGHSSDAYSATPERR